MKKIIKWLENNLDKNIYDYYEIDKKNKKF